MEQVQRASRLENIARQFECISYNLLKLGVCSKSHVKHKQFSRSFDVTLSKN